MFGTMFRLLALIALVAVLAVGGVAAYQLGVADGIAQGVARGADAGTQILVPYGYGWHGGFGFLGFLATLIFLFLVFGLMRAILFGGHAGRHGMREGWGRGWHAAGAHGAGRTGRWGKGPWADEAREHLESWHREAHGDPPSPAGTDRPADADAH